jgi:tRNA(Arg) A34 adenosine deaminase TadA
MVNLPKKILMSDIQQKYMDEAIKLAGANLGNGFGGPFGCVIVKDGEIIASAYNEVLSSNDPTAHAEILAIRRACQALQSHQLDDCDIYTSCEPCPMCLGAIYWSRPRKVYFAASRKDAGMAGFDDDFIYHQLNLPYADRKIPFEQVNPDKAKELFNTWISKNLNLKY